LRITIAGLIGRGAYGDVWLARNVTGSLVALKSSVAPRLITTGYSSANSKVSSAYSWNIDAYGKLMPNFLIITRPRRQDLGPQIIPVQTWSKFNSGMVA